MKRVAIVTDSSASLPARLARDLGVQVVRIVLALNGQVLRDGIDITPGELYGLLRHSNHIPTTSAPSIGDFLRVYASAAETASGIVSIHMSSRLSATLNSAAAASQLVDDVQIRVLDCQTAAMGQGFVVMEAARAAAEGADLETVVARARAVASRIQLLASIDTLEYLHRGGRIGAAARLFGTALNLKPLLAIKDGMVHPVTKVRSRRKALATLFQLLDEELAGKEGIHMAVLHVAAPEEAARLAEQLVERFHPVEMLHTECGPVVGTHAGPGTVGVVYYSE